MNSAWIYIVNDSRCVMVFKTEALLSAHKAIPLTNTSCIVILLDVLFVTALCELSSAVFPSELNTDVTLLHCINVNYFVINHLFIASDSRKLHQLL